MNVDHDLDVALDRIGRGLDRGIRRRAARARWGISVGSFVVAGLLAGVLTAGTLVAPSGQDAQLESQIANFARYQTSDSEPKGTPVFERLSGDATIAMPARPDGANQIVVSVWCLGGSSATVRVAGTVLVASRCRGDGAAETAQTAATIDGARLFTSFDVDGDGRYAVYASWLRLPPKAKPSPSQAAALADGVVTRDEYVQAFERMVGCLGQAGYELPAPSLDDPQISEPSVPPSLQATFDRECYPREFEQVETLWIQQLFERTAACLAAHGIAEKPGDDPDLLLLENHLTPQDCGLSQ